MRFILVLRSTFELQQEPMRFILVLHNEVLSHDCQLDSSLTVTRITSKCKSKTRDFH